MANTIGKDKRPTNSARTAAASRLKSSGMGAAKSVASQTPIERDVAVAEADEEVEMLDGTPADDDDTDLTLVSDDDTSDLVVSQSGAGSIARRAPAAPPLGGFLGFIVRLLLFIPGARYVASSVQELRKVTAPTPREAWNMTLVVVAMSVAIALLLGAADIALIQGLQWVVKLGTAK